MAIGMFFLVTCMICGIFFGIKSFRESRKIFFGTEKSQAKVITNSLFAGLSVSLFTAALILGLGLVDPNYDWSAQAYLGIILVSIVPGIVVTLGSYYQFFVTGRFREKLIQKISEKEESKKHSI